MLRFPPNANGNVAPYAKSAGELNLYPELTSDSTGQYLIAPNGGGGCASSGCEFDTGISSFGKQFANNAKLSGGSTSIFAFFPQGGGVGVADDAATKTYLASGTDGASTGIFRFAEDTKGYGTFYDPASFTPPIISIITSDTCAGQLALGYLRNIYAVHSKGNSCSSDAIYVYEHDASGNAKPIRILSGPKTGLSYPYGIYEGK